MVEEFPIVEADQVKELARKPGSTFTFNGQMFKTDDPGENGEDRVFPVLNITGLPRMTIEDSVRQQFHRLGISVITAGDVICPLSEGSDIARRTDFDGFSIAESGK